MRQQTLAAQTGFEKYGRKTKRERFLEEMEQVVPWTGLRALVEPHYPNGENGRPPVGLSIMLRVYFLQQWFNLSDPGAEDALYESNEAAMKLARFAVLSFFAALAALLFAGRVRTAAAPPASFSKQYLGSVRALLKRILS